MPYVDHMYHLNTLPVNANMGCEHQIRQLMTFLVSVAHGARFKLSFAYSLCNQIRVSFQHCALPIACAIEPSWLNVACMLSAQMV